MVIHALPDPSFGYVDSGDSVHFTAIGVGIATWDWDFGDMTVGSGMTSAHAYDSTGSYVVCLEVTDSAGCMSTGCDTVAVVITSSSLALDHDKVQIFPNPVSQELNIKLMKWGHGDLIIVHDL